MAMRRAINMSSGPVPDARDQPRIDVAIMARAPVPGLAKTRLIPALGAAGAARLQSWLLQRTVAMTLAADVGPVSLWCAGDPAYPEFAGYAQLGQVSLRVQPEGDLGWRMLAAIRAAATSAGILVIGTDCPALTPLHLHEAAAALAGNDAVVTPAEDGGYVLIGMRIPAPELFTRIDWGSENVMAQTRLRLRELGWVWHEPATLWDVDRPADLVRACQAFPALGSLLGAAIETP
jgi:rSAM/selenodomain-associated transferase 1